MDGSYAFRYAKLLGKDGGVTPQQAFEASKTVNDDIVFLLSLIRTVLPCSMKMESSYQR